MKAVVVLWTENSIGSKRVTAEADLADRYGKLVCVRDPQLDPDRIPLLFAANTHIDKLGDIDKLLEALELKKVRPRI